MEEQYRLIIRNEIDTFRKLFKQWVATFEKDECEDEWGLFLIIDHWHTFHLFDVLK